VTEALGIPRGAASDAPADERSRAVAVPQMRRTLRGRIAALTAGAVAAAVLAVSLSAWVLVRNELRRQVDDGLRQRAAAALRTPGRLVLEDLPLTSGPRSVIGQWGLDNTAQIIDAHGAVLLPASPDAELPVTEHDLAVAAGDETSYFRDVSVEDENLRLLVAQIGPEHALILARSLAEVDGTLRNFAILLGLLAALGVAGAAGAGVMVARSALQPVERLTHAAEHVARTKELDAAIEVDRTDELGRLATSFNEMLTALATSRAEQQQLVADASHELRTPLTSLRTNIEVLQRQPDMDPAQREKLLADVRSEMEELTALVSELVDLATEARGADIEEATQLHLDEIVDVVVERAKRRSGREIGVISQTSAVEGRPLALERAISNLVDNAIKWGPPAEPIEIEVAEGKVEVRDRGPGIAAEDRDHVFDRFYRATTARPMPGSGLGLSIVKQVVDTHGGRVWASSRNGGGAAVGFEIPPSEQATSAEIDHLPQARQR
jgi:two-component system, OmpR family, sensor histidine kinase MprB